MHDGIDHIGIVVNNLEKPLKFFRDLLGYKCELKETPRSKVALVYLGNIYLEIMQPTVSKGNLIDFLQEKGEGVHHIALKTNDLEGLSCLFKKQGVTLLNNKPERGVKGDLTIFAKPEAVKDLVIQLVEKQ